MALGISFIPNQQAPDQQNTYPGQQEAPLQQALQMISLRVPRFTNANAIVNPQLQRGRPGQLPPVPGTPEWEELMRRLTGGLPSTPPGGQPPPATPPPSIGYPAPKIPQEGFKPLPPGGFTPPPGFFGWPKPPGPGQIVVDQKSY